MRPFHTAIGHLQPAQKRETGCCSRMDFYEEKVDAVAHNVSLGDLSCKVSYGDVEKMYRKMLCMRYTEESAEELYTKGLVRGFCHLDIGQEEAYAALCHVARGDRFVGSYRCHALAVAAGIPVREIVAELLGRAGGVSKGKGGSMHLYNELLYGGHGIVGAQVPIGCGMAYALKYSEGLEDVRDAASKAVVFCFYGDGASNQGQIHESFNMAKIWNLPIVFVVVNNAYSMWTPVAGACANDDFYKRADFLPGLRVSGRSVFAVARCLEVSREHALQRGPLVVQVDAYRLCGHSTADSVVYRDEAEVRREREKNAAGHAESVLARRFGAEHVADIKAEVRSHVAREVAEALAMPEPETSELLRDIIKK